MSDMLIRGIPDEVMAAIDARASALGISRSEYVRRRLAQDAAAALVEVHAADLLEFSRSFTDLADEEVMARAWE